MKVIPNFSRYSITETGEVFDNHRQCALKSFSAKSIKSVTLNSDDGRRLTKSINALLKLVYPPEMPTFSEDCVRKAGSFEGVTDDYEQFTKLQKELREEFRYIPETGGFYRIEDGYEGWVEAGGYRVILFNRKIHKVHRLIFAYMLGELPPYPSIQVDHIDHNRQNNRWDNLRLVKKSGNSRNISGYTSNSSGATGVSWHKKQQKWVARIMIDNRPIQIGSFSDKETAIKARQDALIKYNFHENHGKFK